MSWLEEGDSVQVSTRASHQAFHPPSDSEKTPIIMFAAGTGIAPFHGFVQERFHQLTSSPSKQLATAILYLGVRREKDIPYLADFEKWQAAGAVQVRYVFSREPEKSKGCKYVQDRVWEEREELVEIFDQAARVYVCGSAGLGEGIREVVKRIYREKAEQKGVPKTDEEAESWFDGIRNERYAVDVFN